ncbi:hypothetical protein [Solicola gregarius]|uniref:Uncharacterized protein n=1 Tax=Solicola gregarius TaxID=2908642 RepID=A0AA46TJD4_9ACTN|nr:hypothetical protein [Solicola gregarius]UYM06336.1 hypothetical protein L0C25_04455 [Solicola gregarius]
MDPLDLDRLGGPTDVRSSSRYFAKPYEMRGVDRSQSAARAECVLALGRSALASELLSRSLILIRVRSQASSWSEVRGSK